MEQRERHSVKPPPQRGRQMARFFAANEADPAVLSGRTIATIGYGNQG
jgi:hypothetical protein